MKRYYIVALAISLSMACGKEQSLTPNPTYDAGSMGATGSGGTTKENSIERYIEATIDGKSISLVQTENLFDFNDTNFTMSYNMGCSGDCIEHISSGLSDQGKGTLEVEFFLTYASEPQTEQEIFDRIRLGKHNYKLYDSNSNPPSGVDSVIIRYTDANNKEWASAAATFISSAQTGSSFTVNEALTLNTSSPFAYDYEKDPDIGFDEEFPDLLVSGGV